MTAGPIVFLGDSITFSWPDLFDRPTLVNRGVPGHTTGDMRVRFDAEVLGAGALGVHLLGGINDIAGNGGVVSLEQTRANLRAMAEDARRAGLQVWLASVLPVCSIWWNRGVDDAPARVQALNAGLAEDADAVGATYVDYHRRLSDPGGRLPGAFGVDGVHLSPAGYAEVTPLALAALERA